MTLPLPPHPSLSHSRPPHTPLHPPLSHLVQVLAKDLIDTQRSEWTQEPKHTRTHSRWPLCRQAHNVHITV